MLDGTLTDGTFLCDTRANTTTTMHRAWIVPHYYVCQAIRESPSVQFVHLTHGPRQDRPRRSPIYG